jgi:hypothetical protein
MVARGPGAVGCVHCTKLGAVVACGVCKRLVCEACAKDWSTCDQPWGRVFRLGTTGRLLDVDPTGKLGLVTRWRGPMRYIDLRALRWIEDGYVPPIHRGRGLRPRLSSDGRMFQADWRTTNDLTPYCGLSVSSIAPKRTHTEPRAPEPVRSTGMSLRDDRLWYVTMTEQVAIIRTIAASTLPDHATPVTVAPIDVAAHLEVALFDPLPRKVIQCAFFDDARELIVSASWGEVAVHRILGGRLDPVCHVKTTGDVVWVAVAGPHLAAHVKAGADRGITVWRLDANLAIASVALRIEEEVAIAALSRDGRYLAVGLSDERVVVYALDDGTSEIYDEHTDDVSYVAFVGDEQLLVTADDDNRVILRPRTPLGYARPLMETELGGD